jgi:hypothetical protein
MGESSYFSIMKNYYSQASKSGAKTYVTGPVTLAGTTFDNYSQGKNLKGNALPNIIEAQINAKKFRVAT